MPAKGLTTDSIKHKHIVSNEKYAEILIGNIGEFYLEFYSKNLESINRHIELYGTTPNEVWINVRR